MWNPFKGIGDMVERGRNLVEEKAREVKATIENVVSEVKYEMERFVDKVFGRSYSGTSVEESVDVDKDLSEFKKEIQKKAGVVEKERIKAVMEGLNILIEAMKEHYPAEAKAVETSKKKLNQSLVGTIVNHVEEKASLGNAEFETILKMQLGEEKRETLRQAMNQMLADGEDKFNKKLETGVKKLNKELESRLRSAIGKKETDFKKESDQYERLMKQVESNTLDMNALELSQLVTQEACDCLREILTKPKEVQL